MTLKRDKTKDLAVCNFLPGVRLLRQFNPRSKTHDGLQLYRVFLRRHRPGYPQRPPVSQHESGNVLPCSANHRRKTADRFTDAEGFTGLACKSGYRETKGESLSYNSPMPERRHRVHFSFWQNGGATGFMFGL
jgi:hypothetical protein